MNSSVVNIAVKEMVNVEVNGDTNWQLAEARRNSNRAPLFILLSPSG